MEDRQSRNVQN